MFMVGRVVSSDLLSSQEFGKAVFLPQDRLHQMPVQAPQSLCTPFSFHSSLQIPHPALGKQALHLNGDIASTL
jgi:hypothetical protein